MASQAAVAVPSAVGSSSRPHRVMPTVTAESLMAELAAAKQSGAGQHWVQSAPEKSETPQHSGSAFDRALVYGAVAVGLFALLTMSPWRDRLPGIERINQFAQSWLG